MNEKTICRKYGHDFQHQEDYSDGIVQHCVKCGYKEVYLKHKDGSINNEYYNFMNRRVTIQPFDVKAWIECNREQLWRQKLHQGKQASDEETGNDDKGIHQFQQVKV